MPTKQPFSSKPYQYAATDFGNIAYREAGSGPAAVFVHGVLLNGHLWDPLIERLAGIRRCIAVDILATAPPPPTATRIFRSTPRLRCLPPSATP